MPSLPPGPRYLISQLPNVITPPTIVYGLAYLARERLHLSAPTWLLALAYLLSWPLAFTAFVQWHDHTNARRARASGTVIPRAVEHKWPGSIDLLRRIFALDKTRYMGASPFRCDFDRVAVLGALRAESVAGGELGHSAM